MPNETFPDPQAAMWADLGTGLSRILLNGHHSLDPEVGYLRALARQKHPS
jgi:hypothetical protein